MFPASSAANYRLHFFLPLLGCFQCPHQVLQTQPAEQVCTTELAKLGAGGWGLRVSLQGPHSPPAPGSCLAGHSWRARTPTGCTRG